MFEIGLSTCGKVIDRELFAAYQKAGITAMEVCCNYDKYQFLNYPEMKKLSEEYGIKLWSYHLPFCPFSEIDISAKEIAQGSIAYWSELIKKGAEIGIDKFVVHPSGEEIFDWERAERFKTTQESLVKLADIAAASGAVIAVEDLPRTCIGHSSDEINELISVHDALRVCFDSNHMLKETPENFVRKVGDKIVTTHISDYDFIDERHWLPGEGKVNWQEVLKALKEVGYQGAWLYEISFASPATLNRGRDLTCDDFANNARELFASV